MHSPVDTVHRTTRVTRATGPGVPRNVSVAGGCPALFPGVSEVSFVVAEAAIHNSPMWSRVTWIPPDVLFESIL
jgi:hypothetical protein